MQMARQVIDLVNQERAGQGLSALRVNTELMEGAQIRSREIVTKFSHERPNGEQGISWHSGQDSAPWAKILLTAIPRQRL